MSADLTIYRALSWVERAIGMDYAPRFALHKAADVYQVPVGELAELLLMKLIECGRAREERDTLTAADSEVEDHPRRFDLEQQAAPAPSKKAIGQPAKSAAMRAVWAARRRAAGKEAGRGEE